jgi:hypothetical protein
MKSMSVFRFLAKGTLLALAAGWAGAQTHIDLRTQSKDVDFSAAVSTKPFQTGTVLPGTCSPGQIFFKTDATAGQNIYECAATDTWCLKGGNSTGPTLRGNTSWSGNNDFAGAVSVTVAAPWVATPAAKKYTAGAKQADTKDAVQVMSAGASDGPGQCQTCVKDAMVQLPEVPYFQIEMRIVGAFVLALLAIHLWRVIKSELRSRRCVFCGKSIAPDEHAHHLEICGLKMMYKR